MNNLCLKRFLPGSHGLSWGSVIAAIIIISPGFSLAAQGTDAIDDDLGPAPGNYRILPDNGEIKIPFEIFRGDIRITGEINGRPVRMLIDNGFMWDQLLFFGSPTVDSLGLEYDGEAEVGGSGEGDPVASKTASAITIRFPGVEFYDQTAIITPYSSGVSNLWWGAEGQVSATFLKHFVVDVDFDEKVITLIEPEAFVYGGNGFEVSIEHLGRGAWGIPSRIELTDGRTRKINLMMDLGYGDALWITCKGPHAVPVPEKSLPGSLGFGIQGETLGHFGRIRSVEIGGHKVHDIVAGFVSEDYEGTTSHESMIGLELLSHFNIIFDYPGHRIFFEPNHTFHEPFEYNMSGIAMRKAGGDYLEVLRIHPNSPAADAGMRVGDRVVTINGRPAVDYDVWDLRPIMRREGSTVRLTLLRDSEEIQVSLVLRRLI